MEFISYSHRNAEIILSNDSSCIDVWEEVKKVIKDTTETEIMNCHTQEFEISQKSISHAINKLFKDKFSSLQWSKESYIFKSPAFKNNAWRLDFAKESISIEVAFNHSGSIAWNLMKPVIASELNHVEKKIQTKIGIIICATKDLQSAGGFDNAIGTYEQYIQHLNPLMSQLTIPLMIIGLKSPKKFRISHYYNASNKRRGRVTLTKLGLITKQISSNGYTLNKTYKGIYKTI